MRFMHYTSSRIAKQADHRCSSLRATNKRRVTVSLRHSMYCPCCDMTPGAASRRRFLMLAGQSAAALALFPHLAYADNDSAGHCLRFRSRSGAFAARRVFRRMLGRRAQFDGPHLRAFARQYHGPAYTARPRRNCWNSIAGRHVRPRDRPQPVRVVVRATVQVDPQDNIWVTDKGSDMIIKFTPEGRVAMVFGRKQEASDEGPGRSSIRIRRCPPTTAGSAR